MRESGGKEESVNVSESELDEIRQEAESWSAGELLEWVNRQFRERVALPSSFGAEGMVLIDMSARAGLKFDLFTLDTDFLFPQTYALMDEVENRYPIGIERIRPALTPEMQVEKHGEALWARDPNLCCQIRKVEPLKAKLRGYRAWISGIRREQSATRANTAKVGWDAKFNLVKVNPLADWTGAQVWDYIRTNRVPYNPLHDQNYPSIGCTHCTRAVAPGEDMRAGRWPRFAKTECGLHEKG